LFEIIDDLNEHFVTAFLLAGRSRIDKALLRQFPILHPFPV
jgi:hypothetical protein